MPKQKQDDLPIQPVDSPILCNPYDEPGEHWLYDRQTGIARREPSRRQAGYWYKSERTATGQMTLGLEEDFEPLTMVNLLRQDVKRWRESEYRGASPVTRELLRHWTSGERASRLFFCQREAVETIIWLAEIAIPGRWSRTQFRQFSLDAGDLACLLRGERPSFAPEKGAFQQTLADKPSDESLLALQRMACKMATGSGKTVVMSMLIAWAFCNRAANPNSREFPNAALVCSPNLTVKERLQVLRPEHPDNYYTKFDIVPVKYRPGLLAGKVLVANWHGFALESPHKEGDKTYRAVDKGEEPPNAFAKRVLGDLYERMPIMVLNDEGHHCWRRMPETEEERLEREEAQTLEQELAEATIWTEGLDRINNARPDQERGIAYCIDLSATPFYIKGSGHPEGRPFPWIVSDFGLVDAIESGIVKIPRLPVRDTTGRPDPKYFKLWRHICDSLKPGQLLPGRARRPRPEVIYSEAEGALQQIASQWIERFHYIRNAKPGTEQVPPVLIVVCDNTDIAEVFYRKISGESEEDVATIEDLEELLSEEDEEPSIQSKKRQAKKKKRTVFGMGAVFPEYFANTPEMKRTIRIDSKLLADAESEDPNKSKQKAAEELRKVVASVGKAGMPGEHVRCVVSVAMLTEGWDASNVTHILGLRAFNSQLLCEQVVGRGLRRMDYEPDPNTGLLTEEYVDVYGIPFSVIPFKGRSESKPAPEDKPKQHVKALPERSAWEQRFPVVEGYVFALTRNNIRCDVKNMEPLELEPFNEPTATFVSPTVGYREGAASQFAGEWEFAEQNRDAYYESTHLQQIEFWIARMVMDELHANDTGKTGAEKRILRLQSRHQLFPQVYRYVNEYIRTKVRWNACDPCELGLQKYVQKIKERIRDGIVPDTTKGEPPLLPVLNRYKPVGTTAEVDFKTVKPCVGTMKSHINQVVSDTAIWENSAAFRLDQSKSVLCYARNDHLGLTIPYVYMGVPHSYEPDFLVQLTSNITVVLEIKGFQDEQDRAKHQAAKRWCEAVNNWGELGTWVFHENRHPQSLGEELAQLNRQIMATSSALGK